MSRELLNKINSPADLEGLSEKELDLLAGEIREFILEVVSHNGGHLASSLGTVELTLALHRIFSSPQDKLIWDVGHQAYTHKIITGRREVFPTLRLINGISGFLKPSESEHDAFISGHAGNSISVALGMAIARDLQDQHHKVVAIIGDGSLACGMPFEAMNHGGPLATDLVVVLNDNKMSISKNVGSVAKYLNHIVQSHTYNRSKTHTREFLRKCFGGSETLIKIIRKLQESIKGLFVPSIFFEDLGFRYIGPIDGHNIHKLLTTFKLVHTLHEPVLVHVVTQKGRGYNRAELRPEHYHGTPKFDPEFGVSTTISPQTYTSVFGANMVRLGKSNNKLVAITAAMAEGTGLESFGRKFPTQFFDVGIAEGHAITCAAGMAKAGLRPVVAIYSSFLQRAYDSIMHDVLLQKLPVVFAIDRAGLVGADGATHHGLFDIAYLRTLPNIILMSPRDGAELRAMLDWAILENDCPVAIRYPRGPINTSNSSREVAPIALSEMETVHDGQKKVTIFSYGHIFAEVEKAANILLTKHKIDATLINARFAKPINKQFVQSIVKETQSLVVTAEEGSLMGGFGAAIDECIAELPNKPKVLSIGILDMFVEHGTQQWLREQTGLDAQSIAKRILQQL
ncbi:1-deoxy-D-xylulose-5-phosphate synthase [Candidatus Sumerlaeota bacterium]|nr:1-deoxy-D-xylulose-5-phosphate synthase [Candidatus Sumerlaeales bacterium]NLD61919.1 1-deoxy-D-xylulose-5-phosphate synthase [Candidatus Sumerlaeota bacterium]